MLKRMFRHGAVFEQFESLSVPNLQNFVRMKIESSLFFTRDQLISSSWAFGSGKGSGMGLHKCLS